MGAVLSRTDAEPITWIAQALSAPARVQILDLLLRARGECSGASLRASLTACGTDLSQPTISHHMKTLTDAGLVDSDQRGRLVFYDLTPLGRAVAGHARSWGDV